MHLDQNRLPYNAVRGCERGRAGRKILFRKEEGIRNVGKEGREEGRKGEISVAG